MPKSSAPWPTRSFEVNRINFTFRTGGDNLRSTSELFAWLIDPAGNILGTRGQALLIHPGNINWTLDDNHDDHTFVDVPFTPTSNSIAKMGLQIVPHPQLFQGDDSWEIAGLTIHLEGLSNPYDSFRFCDIYSGQGNGLPTRLEGHGNDPHTTVYVTGGTNSAPAGRVDH